MNNCGVYSLLLILFVIVGSVIVSKGDDKVINDNQVAFSDSAVVFDPYISAIDEYDRFRYNTQDLLPMISKIATKFKRLVIPLSPLDLKADAETSVSLSPMAVAIHNNLPSTTQKLEVWLSYNTLFKDIQHEENSPSHDDLFILTDRFQSLSQQANLISESTVTTFLFPYDLVSINIDYFSNLTKIFKPRWGLTFHKDKYFLDTNFKSNVKKLQPNIVVMNFRLFNLDKELIYEFEHFSEEFSNNYGDIDDWMTLVYSVTIADTDTYGKLNFANLASFWMNGNKWGQENNIILIFSKAFDTPYEETLGGKTCGWWRLVENHLYNSTQDYVFEEKLALVSQFEEKENTIDWNALKNRTHFDKNYTEIVFSLYDLSRAKTFTKWPDNHIRTFWHKIVKRFNKLVLLFQDDTNKGITAFIYEIMQIQEVEDLVEVTIIIMPKVKAWNLLKGNAQSYRHYMSSVKTYAISFSEDGQTQTEKTESEKLLTNLNITNYNVGYALNISICGTYRILNNAEQLLVNDTIYSSDLHTLIFYFTEAEETVKLGAKRMFHQRVLMMEKCRQFATEQNIKYQKLSFMMVHYHAQPPMFYENEWSIANFIEYWQLLSDWAKNSKTSVILNNAADMDRNFKHSGEVLKEVGWWRYQDPKSVKKNMTKDDIWIDKLDDAILRFNKTSPNPSFSFKDSPTNEYKVVLGITIPLFVLITVLISMFYLIRRYFREKYLTRLEIDEFFNGSVNSSQESKQTIPAQKMPYDKTRYEIGTNEFTLGDELGSGEFGRVCMGRVIKDGETVVAIKMVNPINIHKTAISGLLSEIKVLSYIGKHENITELIGANTQDIQIGKVYIFLELCKLGSLENRLRKMRPLIADVDENDGNMQEQSVLPTADYRLNKYLNMLAMKKIALDLSQHQDMYRWSKEICNGMQYLAYKHVVHADLATRNVLLNADNVAKICDFGLSRRMYNYTNYVKQQQEPLPWKWMSPESLRMLHFSEKSDVWAYGVTLWEIYTLGDSPYAGLAWNMNFADMLEGGFRLGEPKYNDKNMYQIMKECWRTNAESRPTFADLRSLFD